MQENTDAGSGRGRAVGGVVLALALSASLAWCVGRGGDSALDPRTMTPASPAAIPSVQTRPAAHAEPSEAQVAKAYEDAREVYAQGGAEALTRFSQGCLESLQDDARVLDYCLAFGLFADAIRGRAPDEAEQARRLAAAGAALPDDANPAARLDAVRRLTRNAGGAASPTPSQVTARAAAEAAPSARKDKAAETRKASSRAAAAANAKANATRCRLMSTPAERVLCADASLRAADRRMRAAYNRAISSGSGAERRQLVRDQAAWRVELHAAAPNRRKVAALYESRIRELRAASRR
ncbi:lysozyme inhibitor LprI family protein [Phenylobacterium deserti]|uniref:Lysozyme inhibitor LprI N-terminal domain-containing protein n=1 Tax=Phenylobacterium deserti TaxID=1914756 RepID=A0A328AVC9_9CAUL|nr:lysozyme inhibitor LprI family protein [Phenylobacterium deserti]RAK58121.1 hypothetical protein DJ018_09505 [Phenylobacterium deserti]